MSGELYNIRKIMLRGTELSKMDSDVLSNYDDKKTVLSSYLVKKLISQSAAKSSEFDNSITSEQEMWQIKTLTKETITEASVFEQEEGVKMYPIKLESGVIEDTLDNLSLKSVILSKNVETNAFEYKDWKFSDVKDFYSSVYPKQFSTDGEVEKLGLMVVDFSVMNLQQLSEIHIPKLIKVNIPNDQGYYDSHWFIPIAINTPIINKSILIDAPSAVIVNPQKTDNHYESGTDKISSDLTPSTETATELAHSYEYILHNTLGTMNVDTQYTNVTITSQDGYDTIDLKDTTTNHPYIQISDSTNTKKPKTVQDVEFKNQGSEVTVSLKTIHTDNYLFMLDKQPITTFAEVSNGTDLIVDGVVKQESLKILIDGDKIGLDSIVPGGDRTYCNSVEYTVDGVKHKLETTKSLHIYDSIDVRIRMYQFTCGKEQKLTSCLPTKLFIETVNGYSIPSSFISKYGDNILTCAYSDNIANDFYSLHVPAYYQTVALQKLDTLSLTDKKMIMYEKACIIVPKDAQISVDYTEMYAPNCNFNIIILEPSYLIKMKGTLSKPVDRHRYLNMEDYLMELPYRHYNNMLMDSLFSRSYENYDQTYKLVVEKYDDGTFVYADGVIPLSATTSTGEKKAVDKYLIATKLVDEKQNILTLSNTKKSNGNTPYNLSIGVDTIKENEEVKPVHINITNLDHGLDVFGTSAESKVEIELPIIDISSETTIIKQATPPEGMSLLTADKITIHSNNFINYYNTDTNSGDVVVNENRTITKIPTHIKSDENNKPIKAILKIDKTAIGPDLKTKEVREKMCPEVVSSPITLYTLGEAGWSATGQYANIQDGTILTTKPTNIFTKVLVPKDGLDDLDNYKNDWLIAYAKMLRLIYPSDLYLHLSKVHAEAQTRIDNIEIPASVNSPPSPGANAATQILSELYNSCDHSLLITGTARKISVLKTEVDSTWPDDQKKVFYRIYNEKVALAEHELRNNYATTDKITDVIDFY